LATHAAGEITSALTSETSSLRKELRLSDLILAQILLVVIPDIYGSAAKAGPSHVVLWIVAILLFFIPQALVVSHLSRRMPLEGGLYEWARSAFGDLTGFLVAWNLWLYIVFYVATIGLVTTTFFGYAFGSSISWIASSRLVIILTSFLIIVSLALIARLGLAVGKWVSNAGSVLTVLTICVLILLPYLAPTRLSYHPLRLVAPPLTLFSLSVFSKMTFGALCGFEYVAIFAGESRDPSRNITRSILVTAPVIALLYILGTSAIQAFVPPDSVNMIGPIPQAMSAAFVSSRFGQFFVSASILLLLANYLSVFSINFSGNARLPMVAGWDHLLPPWFTRLHPRYRTPVNSILFVAVVTLALSIGVMLGVGEQEAFELLQIGAFSFYALAYLALFAIPVLARPSSQFACPWWLRAAALSGFLLTLLFVLLSAFPIIPVESASLYSEKTLGFILGANFLGLLLYGFARRSASRLDPPPSSRYP
jgi:glutamate:GABA antiporter